ncbi:MAG: hypothetical protein UMR38_05900 [Candidatus Izemoplasma sp.]|nr:hypothetical protein [Candidatus Izemoplasma sp.]
MYWKFPLGKWFAPRKDGLYIVKMQGRVKYIGIAFKNQTGRNIKQDVKYHFNHENTDADFMYTFRQLCSVKTIPMDSYEAAEVEQQRLKETYQKHLVK